MINSKDEWIEEDLEFPYGLNIVTQVDMLNLLEEAWVALTRLPGAKHHEDLAQKIAAFLYRIRCKQEGA